MKLGGFATDTMTHPFRMFWQMQLYFLQHHRRRQPRRHIDNVQQFGWLCVQAWCYTNLPRQGGTPAACRRAKNNVIAGKNLWFDGKSENNSRKVNVVKKRTLLEMLRHLRCGVIEGHKPCHIISNQLVSQFLLVHVRNELRYRIVFAFAWIIISLDCGFHEISRLERGGPSLHFHLIFSENVNKSRYTCHPNLRFPLPHSVDAIQQERRIWGYQKDIGQLTVRNIGAVYL